MTNEQLSELLERVTPGDWVFDPPRENGTHQGGFWSGINVVCTFGDSETYYPTEGDPPNEHDAELIALAPSLARRVLAAEKLVKALWDIEDSPDNEYTDNCMISRKAIAYYRAAK